MKAIEIRTGVVEENRIDGSNKNKIREMGQGEGEFVNIGRQIDYHAMSIHSIVLRSGSGVHLNM
jgi:hypothetical protein